MLILHRYLAVAIIRSTSLVLLLLLGMDFFIQMANEMMEIGHGNYGIWQGFQCVLYGLPSDLYDFFPMAGLIGTLLGLSGLATHSELVVMEAAGMSRWGIVRSVLMTILGLVLMTTLIGEITGPYLLHRAEAIKISAKSRGQAIHTTHGAWFRDGNEFIHVARITSHHELQGISRYSFDSNNQLKKIAYAKEGNYLHKQWRVTHVRETTLTATRTRVQRKAVDFWPLQLKPELLKATQAEPKAMTLPQLSQLIHYKRVNNLRYQNDALAYWQRVLAPLAMCIMMFLAVPFVFGPLRNATLGSRMVVGILIGFSFYTLNQFLGPMSLVYRFPPLLGALAPMLCFAVLGVLVMLRARKVL
ncbi:MAG: LPS export ABC transporter permease LptG [Gammaproteobacteria bacterium]